ncbi:hypothetical protein C5O72_07015 [Muribaculum intestinale]|jgi:hypothetical protein|nr:MULTISPECIES: DUF6046 domain-containing protein [Bacteroidales]PWB10537.1 hypothetical protein C5O72_07015 [Muribaculum intestinale]
MSIFSNIWGTLVVSTARGATDALGGTNLSYRYRENGGQLVYRKHRTYKSKLIQEASRIAIQAAMNEINQLYPRYIQRLQREKRKVTFQDQMANLSTLIENQRIFIEKDYGRLKDTTTNREILAVDQYGTIVPEALMLSYEGEEQLDAGQYYATSSGTGDKSQTEKSGDFKTKLVVHIDLAPQISLSSQKNIVLTPVQGRDFSRKELVSGGDFMFSVNGNIQSNQPGVYPTAAVQKFLLTMQYGGILDVHHFQFDQLGVSRVIIKEWQLGNQDCKNVQPYSFTCVAVEPDEEIQITDTIKELNQDLTYAPGLSKWQQLLLHDKFQQIAQNAMTNILNSSISTLTDMSSGKI